MGRTLAFSLALLAGVACAPKPQVVVAGTPVEIVGRRGDLPVDTRSARLEAATKQLAKTVGHPVRIQIDAALLPEWRAGLEDTLADAVENVVRDLDDLSKTDRDAFEYAAPKLRHIECIYDATARAPQAAFDEGTGRVRARLGAERPIVPAGMVGDLLRDTFRRRTDALVAGKEPDDVPRADLGAYFDRAIDPPGRAGADDDADLATAPTATSIRRAARVWEIAQGNTRAKAQRWLLGESNFFSYAYAMRTDAVRAAPAGSEFRRAEAAYVRFLNAALPSLDDAERLSVARAVFVRPSRDHATEAKLAYPGFDRFAFGLAIADAWIRAGHPSLWSSGRKDDALLLQDFVVCPAPRDARGGRSLGSRCERDWYVDALSTEAGRKTIVDALVARNDAQLTDAAFVAFVRIGARDALTMMRAVERHEPTWKIASSVVKEELAETADKGLILEEGVRLWRADPARRGVALALIAASAPYDNGSVAWKDLPQRLGAAVGPAEMEAFLDVSPREMARAPTVWPALAAGFPRADAIVPRFDRFADDARTRDDAAKTAVEIVHRMCDDNARGDLAKMKAYLEARQRAHPAESWTVAIAEATQCPPPRPSTPPGKRVTPTRTTPFGPPPPPGRATGNPLFL